MSAHKINATKGVKKDDIIVAFMGPTGSGKSFFIDLLAGQLGQRAGNTLASVTSDIDAVRVQHPDNPAKNIVLVDTPGFDDSTRTDAEILGMISEWLKNTYERDVKLSGLIYLHRITDNRMAGTPYKNLRMFGELCGDLVMTQVILVTTRWQNVDMTIGAGREKELKEIFWKHLIAKGSSIARLEEANWQSAWGVVNALVQKRLETEAPEIVLLQEELVDKGVKLNETEAGKALYSDIQKHLAEQKESMATLLAQVEKSNDPQLTKQLRKEYERIKKEFDKTFADSEKLKLPTFKKLISKLSTKKTKASPVKIT